MTRFLFALAFLLGAMAVIWVGLGFLGTDLLALTVTLMIAGVYGLGFIELLRFRRATGTLTANLRALPTPQHGLDSWLDQLHPSLRTAVRRRIEGEPVALPGPTLTPYLSGLLVMLGLLGTFVGMVVTLKGAGAALQGSGELHAIRDALAAPIEGLSLAFGTSVAGVAASAMLGLAATLSRRDRMMTTRTLDAAISKELHGFSINYQRQQAYEALQNQTQALPDVVDKLHGMATQMAQMSEQLTGALTRNQNEFHDTISRHYEEMARSVGETLKESLTDSSRLAATSVRPVVEEAMARVSEQVEGTHRRLSDITEKQLAVITEQFRDTTDQAAQSWQQGLADHQQHSEAMLSQVRETHQQLSTLTEQQLTALTDRFAQTTADAARHWRDGLAEQQQHSTSLLDSLGASLKDHSAELQRQQSTLLTEVRDSQARISEEAGKQLTDTAEHFRATTEQASQHWQQGLSAHQQSNAELIGTISDALQAHNDQFQQQAAELLGGQQQGLDTLVATIRGELATLRDQEAERGRAASDRLAELEGTVTTHLTSLGTALEAPMTRLIETASQTPKAAADVITQLREEMARNSERDNELLDERRRIMGELDALLTAQRDAAGAQREAIETLIASSSQTLSEVGETFSAQVSDQAKRLDDVAQDVTGSAEDIASLSDAFGTAVQLFSDANDKLVDNLQKVETSLEKSTARSDEQLAYYVEQAREVIDLSMASQKEVIDALGTLRQQGAARQTAEAS